MATSDDALAAARSELAALVRERRGPSCSRALPFFVYRPHCKKCREHLDGGDLRPRFTLGRLLHFARRYVEAFPFDAVCDR